MEKHYPQLFKQGDYPTRLGTDKSTLTIAQSGCFVSSLAMKAYLYGHPLTPPQLNALLVKNNIFISENLLPDNALARCFTDILYSKTFDYEPIPTDLTTISNLLADPATTLTIRINLGSGNLHFVEAVACDGHTLHIANPLSGQLEDFQQHYGNPVTANLHVLVYTGPVPSPTLPADASNPTPLAQRFNQAITKANNFDTIAQYLGMPNDQAVQAGAGQIVVERMKFLQKEIEDQQKLIDDLQKKNAPPLLPVPPEEPVGTVIPTTLSDTTGSSPFGSMVASGIPPVPTVPPVVSPKPVSVPVTFQDGSSPISGSKTSQASTSTPKSKELLGQAGRVTIWEFIKAVWQVLFK